MVGIVGAYGVANTVVQFVASLGGYHHPGTLNPWVAGVMASLRTVWVTVPCFLFVLLARPTWSGCETARPDHCADGASPRWSSG